MKFFLILGFVAFSSCEFDPKTFDWSSVKPLTQTKAYREAFSHLFTVEFLDEELKGSRNRVGRIIGGEVVRPYDYPFQVGLLLTLTNENSWCSGALISAKTILSAGSCLVGLPTVTALLGASDILRIKEIIYVTDYKVHESFKRNLDNDIAVLTLAREADLNAEVSLVRLPRLGQSETFVDRTTSIAGWGTNGDENYPMPTPYLSSVAAEVISNTVCLLRYPLYISSSNICTNSQIGTPCEGDEGGALTTIEGDGIRTQIGVFSYQFSRGCTRGWPAVFTRITSFTNWIAINSDAILRS